MTETAEGLERVDRCLGELELHPGDAELLGEIFRSIHTLKGSAGFLGFRRMEALAHAGEHLLGSLRDGRVSASEATIDGLVKLVEGLRALLGVVASTGWDGQRANDRHDGTIAELQRLNASEGTGVGIGVRAGGDSSKAPVEASSNERVLEALNDHTVRIEVTVLDRMMNLVGELVLTRNQILRSQIELESFLPLARRLDCVTAELRETVMQARLQPLSHLFGRYPRMVRELARSCGKVVRIEFSGQETGLDKSLLEAIKDPLSHAIRNCVDHGIEAPARRMLAGKSPQGLVTLRASHHNGAVMVDVVDDGAGIETGRVLAKALERGVVSAEQAAAMTRREVLQLLFLPGFSTSEEITHVSGRGVGMDVVRTNIEKIGGSVEMESTAGVGTVLRMRVPLTLAIVPALVVESGGESFCLPQSTLAELVYVPAREFGAAMETIGTTRVYRLRDSLLPMVWLDDLLEVGVEQRGRREHGFYLAVLEAEGCRFGLVVDELLAPEEIVVKPLSNLLREIGLFSGATVLGNGSLALILDVAATAAHAGVRPVLEEVALRPVAGSEIAPQNYLVFQGRGGARSGERMALPLEVVERIESVALEQVEYVEGRALLQYRGGLLPLEDLDGVLAEARREGLGAEVTVLICHRELRGGLAGMAVRQVLDVAPGELVASGEGRLALIRERLTLVRAVGQGAGGVWGEAAA